MVLAVDQRDDGAGGHAAILARRRFTYRDCVNDPSMVRTGVVGHTVTLTLLVAVWSYDAVLLLGTSPAETQPVAVSPSSPLCFS